MTCQVLPQSFLENSKQNTTTKIPVTTIAVVQDVRTLNAGAAESCTAHHVRLMFQGVGGGGGDLDRNATATAEIDKSIGNLPN
jgi:hypothetical protein